MKHTHDFEKRAENALESLDGIQRATPQPYFYTRLKARLSRNEKTWGGIMGLISRPVYALAMICVVLLINTWAIVSDNTETVPVNPIQQVAADQQLPDEYNVAVNTYFDYETSSTQ